MCRYMHNRYKPPFVFETFKNLGYSCVDFCQIVTSQDVSTRFRAVLCIHNTCNKSVITTECNFIPLHTRSRKYLLLLYYIYLNFNHNTSVCLDVALTAYSY